MDYFPSDRGGKKSNKGDVFEFVAPVAPGRVLFEMGGVTKEIAFAALKLAAHKLNVKTSIIAKEN